MCVSLRLLPGLLQTASAQSVQAPPRPTFKSGVDIVEAEATVTDSNGIPVTDLVATDFQLSIDGKPRPIASLINLATTAGAVQHDDLSGRPQLRSRATDRLFVFVFDESHLSSGAARRASDSTKFSRVSIPPTVWRSRLFLRAERSTSTRVGKIFAPRSGRLSGVPSAHTATTRSS